MGIKQRFKNGFIKYYLLPQDKKWIRVFEALVGVMCFVNAVIALYALKIQPNVRLPTVSNILVQQPVSLTNNVARIDFREQGEQVQA